MLAPRSTGVRHGDDQGLFIVIPGNLVASGVHGGVSWEGTGQSQ